jgi:hypothetical protein
MAFSHGAIPTDTQRASPGDRGRRLTQLGQFSFGAEPFPARFRRVG